MTAQPWYWCAKHEWWSDRYEAAHCQRSIRQFPHPTMDGCDAVGWWCPQEMCVDTRPGPRLAGPRVLPGPRWSYARVQIEVGES